MSTTESAPPAPARKPIFFSLRLKLLGGFTLLFSVVFAAAFYWFYTFATDQALNKVRQDLRESLAGAAAGVNGDELMALAQDGELNAAGQAWLAVSGAETDEDAAALTQQAVTTYGDKLPSGFSDDPRYQAEMDWLQRVHNVQPQAWPYTYVNGNDQGEIIWVSDLWARYNPVKAVILRDTYTSSKGVEGTLYRSFVDYVENDNLQVYTDDWGSWISAYQPVMNSQGEIVGAIGVDFESSYVKDVQQSILNVMVLAFVVTYLTLFVLVFFLSGLFTQPIVALTHAAERIGEGDYEQDLSKYSGVGGLSRDEIGTLAEVFTIMVNKVYQREQALRRQVEELRIEVDEAKRQKQVSEIVDTGFFQELQDKARQMRERRRGGGEAPKA